MEKETVNCLIFFFAGRSVSVRLTIVCSFFFVSFSAAFSVLSGEVRHDPLGLAPELAGGQLTGGGDVLADLGGGRRKRCNFPNISFIKKPLYPYLVDSLGHVLVLRQLARPSEGVEHVLGDRAKNNLFNDSLKKTAQMRYYNRYSRGISPRTLRPPCIKDTKTYTENEISSSK